VVIYKLDRLTRALTDFGKTSRRSSGLNSQ
jgi:hypothetical protein